MLVSRLGLAWLVLGLSGVGGCASPPPTLLVDLKTDLRPRVEFDAVQVALFPGQASRSALDLPARRAPSVPVRRDVPARDGFRVAEFDGLGRGVWLVQVRLLAAGATVGEGLVLVDVGDVSHTVTVRVTRSCAGVDCPGDGTPTAIACLAGACVDPRCSPEAPELCPPAECMQDDECPSSGTGCSVGVCLEGACGVWLDDTRCPSQQACSVDGCAPGAREDAGVRDAGMEIDSCMPGPELCNGIDDDCNPATADGSEEPNLGEPCDSDDADMCRDDRIACIDGALLCRDIPGTLVEVCDGIDDDCDFIVDEGACP